MSEHLVEGETQAVSLSAAVGETALHSYFSEEEIAEKRKFIEDNREAIGVPELSDDALLQPVVDVLGKRATVPLVDLLIAKDGDGNGCPLGDYMRHASKIGGKEAVESELRDISKRSEVPVVLEPIFSSDPVKKKIQSHNSNR